MANLLSTAKNLLIEQAVDVYKAFAEDLPLERAEFQRHYSNLGEILFEIESIESISQLISKIENGHFSLIGLCEDEEELEDFLNRLNESR